MRKRGPPGWVWVLFVEAFVGALAEAIVEAGAWLLRRTLKKRAKRRKQAETSEDDE
jgi:hypothetical protein